MQTFVQVVHAELDAVHRDNRKMLRDTLAPGKIEQRRHQLAPGQIARSAEDDEHVWFELIVRFHSRPRLRLLTISPPIGSTACVCLVGLPAAQLGIIWLLAGARRALGDYPATCPATFSLQTFYELADLCTLAGK